MKPNLGRVVKALRSTRGGLGMAGIGAIVLTIGLVQTTTANPNLPCPEGSVLIAKFDADEGPFQFEKPEGNESIVTISNATPAGGHWVSTVPITYWIVKGGPNAKITSLSPPQTSGDFSNEGLPTVGNSGNVPDVSNIQFCGDPGTPATTTSTTSTAPTTTGVTTTTASATTTTRSTTTVAPTTTTTRVAPTTVPPTTVPPTTVPTTTVPPTTVPPTTVPPTTVPPTTEPPTTEPPTTVSPTTSAPAPTTTVAPTVESTTSTTSSTTSTTVPAAVTTTAPPTGATTSTTTTVAPTVSTSTTIVQVAGIVDERTGQLRDSLPRTGAPSKPLVAVGIILLAIGLTIMVIARLRDRRARV